jgi:hypothetical protein
MMKNATTPIAREAFFPAFHLDNCNKIREDFEERQFTLTSLGKDGNLLAFENFVWTYKSEVCNLWKYKINVFILCIFI